ncbi:MAG: MarR family transcriptional regulator [Woeseiaceae bacterium]|mgnify:FL=1|jgi:homoprotocatechuate degradation regulator HpaR|nr:MarR family transcriptional regulator [Woeseiaceae bacterium]
MATQEFSRSLPMMLYRALDTVMPRFRKVFNEFGLTEQQWRVLRVLWEQDEIAFNQLSALTLIPPPSLVGVVDRLTKGGLVKRRRSVIDRRSVSVFATKAGMALEDKVRPRVELAYAELRQAINANEWEQLIEGLETVVAIESNSDGSLPAAANQ